MKTVIFDFSNSIGVIKINRPEALNSLNREVLKELYETLENLPSEIKVLIVTGNSEKAFVAGADIKEMSNLDLKASYEFSRNGQKVFRKLETLPFPTIACVNGFALGGGLELALACDIIYANEKAKLGLPEVTLGLMPGFGGTVRLTYLIGPHLAKEMIFSGQIISAEDGYKMGIVNKIYPTESLWEKTYQLAQQISLNSPLGIINAKKSIDLEGNYEKKIEQEAKLFSSLFNSFDQREGTQAFIEKRKPNFRGN